MKNSLLLFALAVSIVSRIMVSCAQAEDRRVVIPCPLSFETGRGSFYFTHESVISVENETQRCVADGFAWLFARPAGFVPKVYIGAEDADITLHTDSNMASEEYRIDVNCKKMHIEASGPAGFFYAFQTLRQILPDAINATRHADGMEWTVPVMKIHDLPRFNHRCLKLDVTENFIPVDEIKVFVEYMSMLKLNHLHLFGHESYNEDELDQLAGHALEYHVNVVLGDGKGTPLYSCPEDIVSRVFPSVAALAEVAWSDRETSDKIGFNKAVDVMDVYLKQTVLGSSKSVYDIGLAALR